MARNKRDNFAHTSAIYSWQRWRLLIRNKDFWEDLKILNDTLLMFLDCAIADQKKFGAITAEKLRKYELLKKRTEEKWQIAPIPTAAILLGIAKQPRKALIDRLESLYSYNDKEKPLHPPAVRILQYQPISNSIDIRLDLTRPLNELSAGVEVEIKKFPRTATRKRLDKSDDYLRCWDLANQDKTLSEIAKELYSGNWPDSTADSEEVAEPTPKEIEDRARELRRKGRCGNTWSYKQAKAELIEERQQILIGGQKTLAAQTKRAMQTRRTLRQRVWRNIQSAYKLLERVKPRS